MHIVERSWVAGQRQSTWTAAARIPTHKYMDTWKRAYTPCQRRSGLVIRSAFISYKFGTICAEYDNGCQVLGWGASPYTCSTPLRWVVWLSANGRHADTNRSGNSKSSFPKPYLRRHRVHGYAISSRDDQYKKVGVASVIIIVTTGRRRRDTVIDAAYYKIL